MVGVVVRGHDEIERRNAELSQDGDDDGVPFPVIPGIDQQRLSTGADDQRGITLADIQVINEEMIGRRR
jgi:hypothetical protein